MKTFVVRVFVPAAPELRPGAVQGVVEEVAGGHRAPFANGDELLAFLAERAAGADDRSGAPTLDRRGT